MIYLRNGIPCVTASPAAGINRGRVVVLQKNGVSSAIFSPVFGLTNGSGSAALPRLSKSPADMHWLESLAGAAVPRCDIGGHIRSYVVHKLLRGNPPERHSL